MYRERKRQQEAAASLCNILIDVYFMYNKPRLICLGLFIFIKQFTWR